MAYESKFKRADIDELFEAVLTLEDSEDCYRFFEDICTINEIHARDSKLPSCSPRRKHITKLRA